MDDVQGGTSGVRQGVGVAQTIRRLPDDERRLRVRQRPLGARRPAQNGGQRLALYRLHHQEVAVAVPADLDDPRDVRVVEQRPDARLIEEHPDELLLRGQVGQDPLDDHQRAQGRQLARQRQIRLGHPHTVRQLADQVVPADTAGTGPTGRLFCVRISKLQHCL